MGLASRALRIREGEGRTVTIVVALMLVSMVAIAVGESGILRRCVRVVPPW